MPEGDTIYRTARALGRALTGKVITGFQTEYALLARANDNHPFPGQTVTKIEARGKWLLIYFSNGQILVTHMLMSGSWHIYRPGERWFESRANARIILETEEFVAVAFRVPVARVHTSATLERDKAIPKPEGDVLRQDFNADSALERLKAQANEEIGHVLLKQHVLAGLGNVYKSEICFILGINPFRKVADLSQRHLEDIVSTARRLIAANVLEDSGDGIITYQGKKRRTTRSADPAANKWVYGRKGQSCRRCQGPIERRLQGPNARSTYWCPHCQPHLENRKSQILKNAQLEKKLRN